MGGIIERFVAVRPGGEHKARSAEIGEGEAPARRVRKRGGHRTVMGAALGGTDIRLEVLFHAACVQAQRLAFIAVRVGFNGPVAEVFHPAEGPGHREGKAEPRQRRGVMRHSGAHVRTQLPVPGNGVRDLRPNGGRHGGGGNGRPHADHGGGLIRAHQYGLVGLLRRVVVAGALPHGAVAAVGQPRAENGKPDRFAQKLFFSGADRGDLPPAPIERKRRFAAFYGDMGARFFGFNGVLLTGGQSDGGVMQNELRRTEHVPLFCPESIFFLLHPQVQRREAGIEGFIEKRIGALLLRRDIQNVDPTAADLVPVALQRPAEGAIRKRGKIPFVFHGEHAPFKGDLEGLVALLHIVIAGARGAVWVHNAVQARDTVVRVIAEIAAVTVTRVFGRADIHRMVGKLPHAAAAVIIVFFKVPPVQRDIAGAPRGDVFAVEKRLCFIGIVQVFLQILQRGVHAALNVRDVAEIAPYALAVFEAGVFVVDQRVRPTGADIRRHGAVVFTAAGFVAQRPHDDAGVVLIALEKPRNAVHALRFPQGRITDVAPIIPVPVAVVVAHTVGLEIGFVDQQKAQSVAHCGETRVVRVMAGADRVHVGAL